MTLNIDSERNIVRYQYLNRALVWTYSMAIMFGVQAALFPLLHSRLFPLVASLPAGAVLLRFVGGAAGLFLVLCIISAARASYLTFQYIDTRRMLRTMGLMAQADEAITAGSPDLGQTPSPAVARATPLVIVGATCALGAYAVGDTMAAGVMGIVSVSSILLAIGQLERTLQ